LAQEPETNEAFIREVDDELRRSELEAFWKRWGRWLIAGTVVGLALYGGYLYSQHRDRQASGVEAEKAVAALDDAVENRPAEAGKKLDDLAKSSRDGYRASALLAKAALASEKGDVKGAAAAYATVANDATFDQPWRDLALVRQTATEFDTLKPEMIINRLKPLAIKGNAWFGSAGEMVAIAYINQGKPALAARIFADMAKDEQVPETIRSRAVQMAGVLESSSPPPPSGAPTKTEVKTK
jgi:hypothetical protein